jgi:predicted transcriptional regulator
MLPCSEVHWKILPAVSRELAVMLEKENVPRSSIAQALGTSGAAVSQYISGKRGGEKLAAKAIVACGKLAKKIAAGKATSGQIQLEMAKIIVLAKKSKLGKNDPCVICMSGA